MRSLPSSMLNLVAEAGVYLTLCCARVASAFGAYLHVLWNIGDNLTTIGCVVTMIWLLSCPPYEHQKRLSLLFVSAVLEGASVGPLLKVAIDVGHSP
ncbi:hypothetical protein ARALYDRAFT_917432 [Arabidopsis lyrata subsp. lyrata]|uniref:Uncharacterized protein n=1 Tax=Arabidopsis lyrata subsp. lyrata TaxID=81972 RepID=D7MQT9_ARALL|nr:hypothetical protein ARALYDRAFT_917432 [Arabidopsis lyrata subsp. lyrata]